MVIKQEEELLDYKECAYHVTSEALIQRDAQRQMQALQQEPRPTGHHPILHLRNYKFNLPADKPRYYLLYAPNNTLEDLIRCYRVWDRYLPELFAWYVVHELSKAMLALSQPIHKTSLARTDPEFMENSWILHLDVKPGNIFLGYPLASNEELHSIYESFSLGSASDTVDPISIYPSIKLADFGVSDIENEDGPRPGRGGTTTYMPTEQINFGHHFSIEHQPINPTDPWTSVTNVYGVGRIIYDFLLRPSGSLNEILGVGSEADKQTYSEHSYIHNGNHFLSRNLEDLIGKPFSEELMMLMRRCLSPRPCDRPSPAELEREAANELERARQKALAVSAGSDTDVNATSRVIPEWRVFYRPFEIENMPLGNNKLKLSYEDDEILDRDTITRQLNIPPTRRPPRAQKPYLRRINGNVEFLQAPDYLDVKLYKKYRPERLAATIAADRKAFEARREQRFQLRRIQKDKNLRARNQRQKHLE
jgi:serine/threonine protein kinase